MQKLWQISLLLCLFSLINAPSLAHNKGGQGYVHNTDGELILNSYGECIRTSYWTAEIAIPECEGIEETQAPAPVPVPDPDSDGDGVIDKNDNCPATGSGISVDANGCPPDSDNDGVPDHKDQCPATEKAASVDGKGCMLDGDNDGVGNHRDQCLNTPAGLEVDENGCKYVLKRTEEITLRVNFASNSSSISQDQYAEIKKVANFLKKYTGVKTAIEGHTDSRGDADYNQQLSQSRADAVRKVLIETYGIAASRVTAEGFGEKNPIASNDSKEGRLANRRVVAVMKAQVVN